jgi:hypothetical protein
MTTQQEFVTLNQIYDGELPHEGELLWDYVSLKDFDAPFPVIEVDPITIYNTFCPHCDSTLRESYRQLATKDQKILVQKMRKSIDRVKREKIIILCGEDLVDGFHSVVALALEKVDRIRAIDLCDLKVK